MNFAASTLNDVDGPASENSKFVGTPPLKSVKLMIIKQLYSKSSNHCT
jgi:hypothetical protein